jgi:hypothetical protein
MANSEKIHINLVGSSVNVPATKKRKKDSKKSKSRRGKTPQGSLKVRGTGRGTK